VALYYDILNLAEDPQWEDRDRLVFSKAHGCYALYAILTDRGYVGRSDWETFYKGSFLSGCSERSIGHGIEASCGALGHGLPIATGIAFGAKLQGKRYHTYCLVGDGEMQEGSNWEAVQFAVKHELSNLTLIIDANRLQAMEFLEDVLTPRGRSDDLHRKLSAFGCHVESCNGHSIAEVLDALERCREQSGRLGVPAALVADTVKGYGVLCMENVPRFHFRLPTAEEMSMGVRYES
jgi:transketolase